LNPKYRLLLAVLLTLIAILSQVMQMQTTDEVEKVHAPTVIAHSDVE